MAKQPPKNTWENKVERIMRERETITDVQGEADLTRSEESYFDVIEVLPDRTKNGERYLLSGNPALLPVQMSLLLAIRKMVGESVDEKQFKDWAEAFEEAFPAFTGKSTRLANQGRPWGKDRDKRPRINLLSTNSKDDYRVVELFPDRNNLEESYLFSGDFAKIIQEISTFWATLRRLETYDIGAWVGYPVAQYLRQEQKTGIELTVMLVAEKYPPFVRVKFGQGGFEYKIQPRQVTIALPKREALTFTNLRNACGGAGGLNWGNWQARAYIAPKSGETNLKGLAQMVAGGQSKDAAERNLDRFLALSEGHAVSRTCTEVDLTKGARADDPRSPFLRNYQLYPGWVTVQNSALVRADDRRHGGKPTLAGKLVSRDNKLSLWQDKEPSTWASTLKELMRSPLIP